MGPAWHARHTPQKNAVVLGNDLLTFSDLNASANRLARGLRAAGIVAGESLAIVCRNRIEFPIAYFAAQRIGVRITPVNWHLTADEVAYILDDCGASAVIMDIALAEVAEAIADRVPRLKAALCAGGEVAGFTDLKQFCRAFSETDIEEPVFGPQMLYTSGTTGRPKGVIRKPHGVGSKARRHFLPDHARVLCTGPLYHAAPLSQNMVQPITQGKTVVIMEKFDAEETLRLIERHRITHSHMVATMFHRMLSLPSDIRHKYDLSSLETIWHGAAPTPVHVKHAMIEWLGPKLDEYYAATETGGTEITSEEWLRKPGSVGLPEEGQEISILDEQGQVLPAGQVGTVYFSAARSGGFSYHGDEAKTRSAYKGDRYTLGDQGYLDEDGYLFLTGRSAEVIISGGVNIYPAEVDAILLMHPAVQDAAVVGVPNEEFGEEVKAVVELKSLAEVSLSLADELMAFCRARLAHFKCPRSIDFVDELPRSDAGKVFRRRVRDRYWT